jgi:hypothetical protein
MGGITHVSIDMNALTGKETPNKRSAVRGQRRPPLPTPKGLNYYVVPMRRRLYPELRLRLARGYENLTPSASPAAP